MQIQLTEALKKMRCLCNRNSARQGGCVQKQNDFFNKDREACVNSKRLVMFDAIYFLRPTVLLPFNLSTRTVGYMRCSNVNEHFISCSTCAACVRRRGSLALSSCHAE